MRYWSTSSMFNPFTKYTDFRRSVPETASSADVKKAYRQKSLLYHPDKVRLFSPPPPRQGSHQPRLTRAAMSNSSSSSEMPTRSLGTVRSEPSMTSYDASKRSSSALLNAPNRHGNSSRSSMPPMTSGFAKSTRRDTLVDEVSIAIADLVGRYVK